MGKTAFVTGGTGFIGLNLIELLKQKGWDVTALHRSTSILDYLKRFPVELREGSITDKASLISALPEGTDVVFHVAGSTNMWSKRNAEQAAINVDGTRNLVEVALIKEVKQFIHTSSIAAWGPVTGDVTEETPQKGHTSWVNYERTKLSGEKEALKGIDGGMKVVILNPTGVAGPYDINSWGQLFFALRDKALPGIPSGNINLNHVREVVRAHLAAVDKGRNGENYILAGEDCTFADLIGEIAEVSGISDLPRQVPTPILKLLSRFSVIIASLTGKPPDMTPELAYLMTRKGISLSSEKAVQELDYKIVSWRDAVRDCYEWLVKEGHL